MSPKERKKMVSKRANISLSRQCEILGISRSSLYYTPIGFSAETLELMRQIDKVFTQYPFFPSHALLRNTLPGSGQSSNRGIFAEERIPCGSPPCAQADEGDGA